MSDKSERSRLLIILDVHSHLCEVLRYQEEVEGNLLPLQFLTDQLLSLVPQIRHLAADNDKLTKLHFRVSGS